MPIFIEPDATQYPKNFKSTTCPGLEALTGADMCISRVIPPPTVNLDLHIANRSLFVQIKIDYDICSFDQLHSAIARMQAAKIPKGQAILLPIGEYWEDENSLLRLKGQKAYGNTEYKTLGTIYDMWEYRGGTVEALPPKSVDDLQQWIDRKVTSLDKIEKEGKRDIYPPSLEFVPNDIWQQVEEINDWRNFLVSGMKDFGSKSANSVYNYVQEHCPESNHSLYQVLDIITAQDEKGKPLHKIPLIGKKTQSMFREVFGIKDGENLSDIAWRQAYKSGWQQFGKDFMRLVNRGQSPRMAHKKLMAQTFDDEIAF